MNIKSITIEDIVVSNLFPGVRVSTLKEGSPVIRKEYLSFEVINDMIYSIGGDASSLGYEYDSSGIPKKYNGAIILSNKAFLKLKDVRRAYARYRIRYSQQKPIKMPGKLERVAI